jgi:rod shape-determining protein MreD
MTKTLKCAAIIAGLMVAQVTLLPAYLTDPFKPNLLIIVVAYLALKGTSPAFAGLAFLLGLAQDCFSGLYLGLNGFSFLVIYLLLRRTAGRLYTDSHFLMILVVFLITIANGFLHLFLLVIFSVADGVYVPLFSALLPQGLVNALAASLLSGVTVLKVAEEGK